MMLLRGFVRHHSSMVSARMSVKDLFNYCEKRQARVFGWIRSVRKHKKVTFLDINDGSSATNLQVVLPTEKFSSNFTYGSAIGIEGKLVPRIGKTPKVEFLGEDLIHHTECDPSLYPFASEWNYPNEFVRQYPHLRPRQKTVASMLRVRSKIEMLTHEFFQSMDFTHIHTPAITSSDCEGAGELFAVTPNSVAGEDTANDKEQFFGSPANLTVSGQLHLEACAMGLGHVYTLSPAFRAEKSRPKTHLCEFHMLEVELAFTKCLGDLKSTLEASIKHVIAETLKLCADDISVFYDGDDSQSHYDTVTKCSVEPFLCIEYTEAVDLINSNLRSIKTGPIKWGDDLNDEHERFLTSYHDDCPIFVQNFPSLLKPFYALTNDEGDTCASFDLLFPKCGEMAGGTVREHRYDVLQGKLEGLGLTEQYKWYCDLRRFGGVPHGGYGLGFDRLVKFVLGINNIRDAVPFPRAPKLCML